MFAGNSARPARSALGEALGRSLHLSKGNQPKIRYIAVTAVLTKGRNGRPSILGIRACATTAGASPREACQKEVPAWEATQPMPDVRW
jgi:hypothetical protein